MTWFVIVALLAWVAILAARVRDLRQQIKTLRSRIEGFGGDLAALERRLSDGTRGANSLKATVPAEPGSSARPSNRAAAASTTVPKVSSKVEARAEPEPEPPEPDFTAPETVVGEVLVSELLAAQARTEAVRPDAPRKPANLSQAAAWLSENALAWVGGGVLALGGIFLVAYAAQRGVFGPALRIAGAGVLGLAMIGVSEWLRRQANREARGHRAAAAAAAGAGGATLYAAAWASHALYHFIGLPLAAGLMGLTSLALLALATLHGELLAVLAIGGGLLAPAITGPEIWPASALSVYLATVLAAGYAMTALRRWGWTGLAALAGGALWAVTALVADGPVRAATLALAPAVLSVAALAWRQRQGEPVAGDRSNDAFTLLPTLSMPVAALLIFPLWAMDDRGTALPAAAVAAALLCGLATFAVRRGLAPPVLLLAGYAAVAAAAPALLFDQRVRPELWAAFAALVAAGCGLWTAMTAQRQAERLYAGGGALAALLVSLSLPGAFSSVAPWAAPALAMLVLAAGAWSVARRAEAPDKDLALAFWVWCAATGLLAAVTLASAPVVLPAALAAASAGFALAHARLGWRGWLAAANAAALASLTALINPDLLYPLFSGRTLAWAAALSMAAAPLLVFAGSRLVRGKSDDKTAAEVLSTTAVMIAVAGAFILLRLWADGPAGGDAIDPFVESSLRTLLLLATGLLTAAGATKDAGPVSRWRGQAILVAGAAHGLFFQGLAFNPLAAAWQPAVAGPPLLDSVAVGFLAPALLLAVATRSSVARNRPLLIGACVAVMAFSSLWGLEELRRLFQGASLHAGRDLIGRAEAAAYAVAALLGAASLMWVADRSRRHAWTISPVADLARSAGRIAAAGAIVLAMIVFGWGASPWWGPIDRPLESDLDAGLLFALYAAGAGLTLWLVRAAEGDGVIRLARGVRIGTVLIIFALLTLMLRWGFRGLDMRPTLREASLETWAFSAAWGLYGFALLVFAAARREADLRWAGLAVLLVTVGKVFLFDLARLDGVVRAASFLAVGALLLAAAVIARRLAGDRQVADET